MTVRDICVIIPTVREYECLRDYVENARNHGFDTDRLAVCFVTEDWCDTDGMSELLDDLEVDGAIFDETARAAWFRDRGLAEYAHLIPDASHAQTSFGLLYLWANEFDFGVFIDDDTRPHPEDDFFGTHLENLDVEGSVRELRSDERWVNVLSDTGTDLYPRGYPYAAMDETVEERKTSIDRVVASQGLWTDVPDLDAVRILMDGDLQGQASTRLDRTDFGADFVAAEGQYLTVCSMNLAFRREIVPAFYQLPMDDNRWDVGRFDDIWSGVILKRACDLLGDQVYTGRPYCRHEKAPRSTFDDLGNEVAGLELNEHFWEIVDGVEPDGLEPRADPATNYATVARAVGEALREGTWEQYRNGAFLNAVGESLTEWVDCLEAIERPTVAAPPADD